MGTNVVGWGEGRRGGFLCDSVRTVFFFFFFGVKVGCRWGKRVFFFIFLFFMGVVGFLFHK